MYFAAEFNVGQNHQKQSAIVDTGSDLLAFPCDMASISDTGTHNDSRFLSTKSSTFDVGIDCPSSYFNPISEGCTFNKRYLEGSSISGIKAKEVFEFKNKVKDLGQKMSEYVNSGIKDFVIKAEFGCTTKETGLFVTQEADGIFGLDDGSSILQSIENQDSNNPKKASMGFCFHRKGGFMTLETRTLDHPKEEYPLDKYIVVPYDTRSSDYNIPMNSVRIGRIDISTQDVRTTIDTGTTFMLFPKQIGEAIFDAFRVYCKEHEIQCAKMKEVKLDNKFCVQYSKPDDNYNSLNEALDSFPNIELVFEGSVKTMILKPENYFYQTGTTDVQRACLAIQADDSLQRIIIGAFPMINHFVFIDRSSRFVAIENNVDCSNLSLTSIKSYDLIGKPVQKQIETEDESIWSNLRPFLPSFKKDEKNE